MFKNYFLLMILMPFLSLADVSSKVEEAKQAVFRIQSSDGLIGHGSGFFFGDQSVFVTAFHVLDDLLLSELPESINGSEESIRMRQEEWTEMRKKILEERKQGVKAYRVVKGDESYRVKGIRALDVRNDLAILDVEGYTGPVLHPLDSEVGHKSETYILGFFGENSDDLKMQRGKVNVKRSSSDYFTIINNTVEDVIGSSGGPVINNEGQVIGILSMGAIDSNVVFATLIKYLHGLLNRHRSEIINNLSDQEKMELAYMHLSQLIGDGEDALAEWKYEIYQQSKMGASVLGLRFPYDYEMEQALPHLQFHDMFYDEDGLPLPGNEQASYEQVLPAVYFTC